MKKQFFFFCLLCFCTSSYAQIIYRDSVANLYGTVYAGTLAGPKITIKNPTPLGFYSLRFGGSIYWNPQKWLTVYGIGVGETDQTDTTTPFALFGVNIKPNKFFSVAFGKIASPMTEMRPLPNSSGGQFEPWTKSHILGSALGGKITISPTENFSFVAGDFWRGTEASQEAGVRYGNFLATGYYLNQSKSFGGAIDFTFKRFNTVVMYNPKSTTGMFNLFEVSRKALLFAYSDIGFKPNEGDMLKWQMLRGEWGLFKTSQIKWTKILLGLGYAEEIKSVKGYVFIHI